jgi:hypothetical protein
MSLQATEGCLIVKMSLQLAWNHRIITKFFATHNTLANRTCWITAPGRTEGQITITELATQYFGFSFTGSLLSISVVSPLLNGALQQIWP